jgi:hypothetical protein
VEGEPLILQTCLLQQTLELPIVEVAVIYRLAHTIGGRPKICSPDDRWMKRALICLLTLRIRSGAQPQRDVSALHRLPYHTY